MIELSLKRCTSRLMTIITGYRCGIVKKKQIRIILNMLQENNVIEPINNFSNENDPYRQKIVRIIKKFLYEVM